MKTSVLITEERGRLVDKLPLDSGSTLPLWVQLAASGGQGGCFSQVPLSGLGTVSETLVFSEPKCEDGI